VSRLASPPAIAYHRPMAGETDLQAMLAGLTVSRRPGTFTVATVDGAVPLGDGVHAVLAENEGTTVVATVGAAAERGWTVEFRAAWLTLDVHSSLEAVGLTAAVATALSEVGIACNVLAGFHHDHLLVPVDRADDAVARLTPVQE